MINFIDRCGNKPIQQKYVLRSCICFKHYDILMLNGSEGAGASLK